MPTKRYYFLFATAFAAAFSFQGSRGLFETTEGRYAECAREMLETNNWLMPQLDYMPHWTKPPLVYWAIASGMKLVGKNTWGVRLYAALAFLLLVWATFELAKVMWNAPCGYLAGLVYATSGFAMGAAYTVNTDVLLSLWELLTILAYWKAYTAREAKNEKLWVAALWFFAGLGFLTKGPPSLLALLVILVFQFYLKYRRRSRPKIFRISGILVFGIVGFGWYLWAVISHPELLSYFLFDEMESRVFTDKFHRNPEWYKPLIIYLPYVFFGIMPWFILWPKVIKKYKRFRHWTALQKEVWNNEKLAFLILWLVLPLMILSLAKSRMQLYWLPFFPGMVLLNARAFQRTYTESELARNCTRIAILTLLVFVSIKGILAYVTFPKNMHQLYLACKKYEKNDTSVLVFEDSKLYGLQFYLNGKLTRISRTGEEPWARRDLASVSEEIRYHPCYDRYILIVNSHHLNILQQKLTEAGFSDVTEKPSHKYFLVILDR